VNISHAYVFKGVHSGVGVFLRKGRDERVNSNSLCEKCPEKEMTRFLLSVLCTLRFNNILQWFGSYIYFLLVYILQLVVHVEFCMYLLLVECKK
jgi:hypothetical protein